MKRFKVYFLFFLIVFASFRNVSAATLNFTEPAPDLNDTRPDPDPVPIDYEAEYDKTISALRKQVLNWQFVQEDNIITYNFHEGVEYPFKLAKADQFLSHNPSYGENDTYLGQVVDSYFTNNSVNVTYQMVHNPTLDCMELEQQNLSAFVNFTTYTEVDALGNITVTDSKIDGSVIRNESSYVFYDYGANYFDDFFHNFTLDVSDVVSSDTSSNTLTCVWAVGNVYGTIFGDLITGESLFVYLAQNGANNDKFTIRIQQRNNVGALLYTDTSIVYDLDTLYIGVLRENGDEIYVYIYSDSARTVLTDTLTYGVNSASTDYRYLTAYSSSERNTDPNDYADCYVEELEIGDLALRYVNGYYYTVEMLNGSRALAIAYNASIPANTGFTMEFSNDTFSWVNHNNVAGYEDLTDGFETLDLRDMNTTTLWVWVNGTTTDQAVTPQMFQLRIYTITAQPSAGARPEGWVLTVMIGVIAGALIIYGAGRRRR